MIIQIKSWETLPNRCWIFWVCFAARQFLHRFFSYNGKVKNPNADGFQLPTIIEVVKSEWGNVELTHTPPPPDGRERESSSMVKGILLLAFFQIVMPLLNHLIIFSPLMISEIEALGFKLYPPQPILRFPQFAKQQIIASLYRTHSGLCTLNLATSLSLMFQRLQTGDAIDTCSSSTEGRKAGPGKIELRTLWEATYVTLVTSFWKLVNFLFSSLCPIHRAIWIC